MFLDGTHPTWNDDMRSGHWMQASCRLTATPIDCGPMKDAAYRKRIAAMIKGIDAQEARRARAFDDREARLTEQQRERERREVERKQRDKQRQLENMERRRQEKANRAP